MNKLEDALKQQVSKVIKLFSLTNKEHCHHDDICNAVSGLVDALNNAGLQDQLKRFDTQFSG
jgi:hypothetical protein